MATEMLLIREGNKLGAAEPTSLEAIEAMRHGEIVTATVRRVRNARHHRLFMALLGIVFANQGRYATRAQLLDAVKIATGHYDLYTLPGKFPVQVCVPRSISFARMPQDQFEEFYGKAVAFIIGEVLPGLDREDLDRQVLEMADGRESRSQAKEWPRDKKEPSQTTNKG